MRARNPRTEPSREVAQALEVLAANPEAARALGIFDPWRLDDILENQIVPELRAIRALLETGPPSVESGNGAGFDKADLPIDTVGETTGVLGEGESGEALFDIEGTTLVTEVTTTAQVEAFDPIRITRPNNVVEPIPEEEQQPERRTTPRYATTGEDSISVDNTEFEEFEFEDPEGRTIVADTIVLIYDDDIDISFKTDEDEHIIPLTQDLSPSTFSAVEGVRSTRLLYRQADSAGGAADLDIIALT